MTPPRRCLLLAVLAAACGSSSAVTPAPAATRPPPLPAGCAPILDIENSNLMVRGTWRGRDVRIVVDTGGESTGISSQMAAQLRPLPGVKARYAGASGQFLDTDIYQLEGLTVGGVELAAHQAHTLAVADATDYDFNIGLAAIEPYVVDIDWRARRFCLHRSAVPDRELQWTAMTRASRGGAPVDIVVDVQVGDQLLSAMILDTGAGVSTVNADLLPRIPHRRRDDKVQSIDGSGVVKDEYFVQVAELCALQVCERDHILMPGDDLSPLLGYPSQGILGVPFFRDRRLVLDFPRARIGVSGPAAAPATKSM